MTDELFRKRHGKLVKIIDKDAFEKALLYYYYIAIETGDNYYIRPLELQFPEYYKNKYVN